MADMREALLKAGLVSKKDTKQARHQERVHRKEVGREGVEQERRERDAAFQSEQAEKRRQDQERASAQREQEMEASRAASATSSHGQLQALIRSGVQTHAHGGNRRFFFIVEDGRITFLDLTDSGVRALQDRRAAIVDAMGARSETYCVVDEATASALRERDPLVVKFWGEY